MARSRRNRQRDRHGRGLRGPLSPPQVPLSRTRAERFDDLVRDAIEQLEKRWADSLRGVEFAVEDVPLVDSPAGRDDPVPLGRVLRRSGTRPARVVVYRRPVETRALDVRELGELVHDVVVEQVADLLGVEPGVLDPRYVEPGDDED